jgi:hypothetical protein
LRFENSSQAKHSIGPIGPLLGKLTISLATAQQLWCLTYGLCRAAYRLQEV